MNRTFIISVIFLTLISFGSLSATNYYVDKDATGSNNGSSWANAWQSFSNINWGSISPGDNIYISGGSSSKTYNGSISVGASGSSGNPITITKGLSSGHNGTVIIDGNGTSDIFSFGGSRYVSLSYVTVKNGDQNVRMRTNNVSVDNCTIWIDGSRGFDCRGNNNAITNCTIISLSNGEGGSGQRDGIWSTGGGGHTFTGNYIENRNDKSSDHSDCVQFFQESSGSTIANNFMWQNNTKTSNAMGIYMEDCESGIFEIYNNVVYFPYAKVGIGLRNSQAGMNACSNTFYQTNSVSPAFWIMDDANSSVTNVVIKNNIFYTTSSGSRSLSINETMGSGCEVDGNIHYAPNLSSPIYYLGSSISLSTWNSYSFVGSDMEENPLFIDPSNQDLALQIGSPAIDNGMTLGAPYNIDIEGMARPQGNGWDMGAYENYSGPDVTPPQLQGALINNPTQVILTFSESLESQSSQNASNYNIDNGIGVISAVLSGNGTEVTLTTSEHTPNLQYTVTVSNVTDLSGNTISPQANSAQYLLEADITPPELTGASLVENYSTLMLLSTEQLESNSASQINNYAITNGIQVLSAELLADQLVVKLITTEHTQGQSYQVVVSNVTDLAGNVISSSSNSAQYEALPDPVSLNKYGIFDVTASSTNDPNYHPSLTIDGLGINDDPNSRWAAIPMPEHLIFDLGKPKVFAQSRFSFYGFEFGRIYTYSVSVSNDNTNWTEILTNKQSTSQEWTTEIFAPVSARYIKLLFITSNQATQGQEWAHLWEAEIWGPDQPSDVGTDTGNLNNFILDQNYPNPFNPITNISFSLPEDSRVRIGVYNLIGEHIVELVNSFFEFGSHTIPFDADGFTSGIYLYRMETGNFTSTKKMILLK